MSEFVVRELDLESPTIAARVATIISSELGGEQSANDIAKTIDFSSGTTRLLGGFVGDELVCLNAFMRMGFTLGAERVFGYQSGFSATDKNHRGKGYWPTLLRAAEEHLAARDGAFIFGFPNPVSHPLFERKLSYTTLELFNLRIALVPVIGDRAFRRRDRAGGGADGLCQHLSPDLEDNVAWKRRSDAEQAVFEYRDGQSYLWGKMRSTSKMGVAVKFLEIGGFTLEGGGELRRFFRDAARRAGVRLLYVTMNPENQYFSDLNFRDYGQPVIIKPLGDFRIDDVKVDFFGGMRDTF